MRGFPSSVTGIRKKVFTEVARLAYDGDYDRMEDRWIAGNWRYLCGKTGQCAALETVERYGFTTSGGIRSRGQKVI